MNANNEIMESDIPAPGTPIGGGFAVSRYHCGSDDYLLIVAGKSAELFGKWGTYGQDIVGARSYTDGLANTIAMTEAGSDIARFVRESRHSDLDDWSIPARDQLELMYRYLKPGELENCCSFRDGDNPAALPPTHPYEPDAPAQTVDELFQEDGAEALESRWYWSSTQFSPVYAYGQDFAIGYQNYGRKDNEARVRPVRRMKIIYSTI